MVIPAAIRGRQEPTFVVQGQKGFHRVQNAKTGIQKDHPGPLQEKIVKDMQLFPLGQLVHLAAISLGKALGGNLSDQRGHVDSRELHFLNPVKPFKVGIQIESHRYQNKVLVPLAHTSQIQNGSFGPWKVRSVRDQYKCCFFGNSR